MHMTREGIIWRKRRQQNIGIHPPVIHPSRASALAPSFYGGSAIQLELDQNGRRRFYGATIAWRETWPFVLLAETILPMGRISASP